MTLHHVYIWTLPTGGDVEGAIAPELCVVMPPVDYLIKALVGIILVSVVTSTILTERRLPRNQNSRFILKNTVGHFIYKHGKFKYLVGEC